MDKNDTPGLKATLYQQHVEMNRIAREITAMKGVAMELQTRSDELLSAVKRLDRYGADYLAGEIDNLIDSLSKGSNGLDRESQEAEVLRRAAALFTARYFEEKK